MFPLAISATRKHYCFLRYVSTKAVMGKSKTWYKQPTQPFCSFLTNELLLPEKPCWARPVSFSWHPH